MRQKITVIKSIVTIIIVLWLLFSLTITTDPAERKHFFEITQDGTNNFKVTVTGSDQY